LGGIEVEIGSPVIEVRGEVRGFLDYDRDFDIDSDVE